MRRLPSLATGDLKKGGYYEKKKYSNIIFASQFSFCSP